MDFTELLAYAEKISTDAVAIRRDLHQYPETGFLEYRTATKIINELKKYNFTVLYGNAVNDTSEITSLPSKEVQAAAMERAIKEGADPALVREMADGKTGVVGIIEGTKEGIGKTVAFRFDMDCNEANESCEHIHRPVREGFRSVHENAIHACGHDGHVAIGLLLARILSKYRDRFSGRVKLIFQPAEEGVRGAESMVKAGVCDDVDIFFGGHIGLSEKENGTLAASVGEFLAASKFVAVFTGKSSHAGLAPEEGRNALLASAQAAIALHAISRHGKGASRVNVGVLNAGTGMNVIPDHAEMRFETRGETTEINAFMEEEARRIIMAAAAMYGVEATITRVGYASSFEADSDFAEEIALFAKESGLYRRVDPYMAMNASEDCTTFLNRVTARGGKGIYMMYGAELAAGHHNDRFDFDESVISHTAAFLAALTLKYCI